LGLFIVKKGKMGEMFPKGKFIKRKGTTPKESIHFSSFPHLAKSQQKIPSNNPSPLLPFPKVIKCRPNQVLSSSQNSLERMSLFNS
jgi:hypothetical protein